jgi:hypothetical protein
VQATEADGSSLIALSEEISDSDLADGAGQIILEFLRSANLNLSEIQIIDRNDLKSVIKHAATVLQGESSEGSLAVLLSALRLLKGGYYRSLLMEERERVGRAGYRYEAMNRFRERISKEERDATGLAFG